MNTFKKIIYIFSYMKKILIAYIIYFRTNSNYIIGCNVVEINLHKF